MHNADPKSEKESDADADDLYEQARNMTEQALEAYAQGDKETGDQLIEEAREVDADAVQDVYEELEEDAGSQHDPTALNKEIEQD